MKYWPRRVSKWDGETTAPALTRSGPDPINPLRVARLREHGMTFQAIGSLIAKQDGRKMPYLSASVAHALRLYRCGERNEEGEREFVPARNRKQQSISLSAGVGFILKPSGG